ncbi:uncharacterized protein I303_100698 [Kwoniella dejecticola CBS 10117]|uniref:Alpha-galactosidase n=1 Tax=Kwoniella dejecticola CBS 10117 TaxID=1296121 RepID=A0AAJ8MEJ8_9TREE
MTQAYDDKSGDSYIQHLLLPADSKDIRLPLDWDKLKDVGVDRDEWKVLSFVRVKPFWIEPNLTTIATHPHLASHLTLLNSPDKKTTLAIYPVSTLSVNNVLVFEDGGLKANLQRVVPSESPDEEKVWVICAEATSEIEQRRLVNKVVNLARGLVGGQADKTNELDSAYPRGNGADAVKGNGKEELWDGLGICTWESLLQEGKSNRVFQSKSSSHLALNIVWASILSKLKKLYRLIFHRRCYIDGERARPTKDNLLSLIPSPDEIPIKSFLIDDGWQDTIVNPVDRRLVSFAPWDGFGGPLKDVVSAIKAKGVEKVGVWLTLQGYWEGIHPDSPLVQKYECREYKKKKSKGGLENEGPNEGEEERVILLPTPEKAGAFWEDHIKELKNAGIDFIKCDNQAESNYAYDPEGFHIQQALWSAMLDAVERHLGTDNVIMCMSHNERMLNGPGGLDFDVPLEILSSATPTTSL